MRTPSHTTRPLPQSPTTACPVDHPSEVHRLRASHTTTRIADLAPRPDLRRSDMHEFQSHNEVPL